MTNVQNNAARPVINLPEPLEFGRMEWVEAEPVDKDGWALTSIMMRTLCGHVRVDVCQYMDLAVISCEYQSAAVPTEVYVRSGEGWAMFQEDRATGCTLGHGWLIDEQGASLLNDIVRIADCCSRVG